ncbi:hypothetical protein [uncultured Aquimarina sp.]|uniref:hypothetical protein n=1 Tax=uncultured Aquimarina sp. TaxID=575652 RepID=UPI00262D3098|nr:hypothetical protein [uncultured Aquimarina sp.]
MLVQLLKRSKDLKDFCAAYNVSHKLGLYHSLKAKKDNSLYYLNTIKIELEEIKDDNPKLAQVNKIVKSLMQSSSDIALIGDKIESQCPRLTVHLRNKHPTL